MSSLFYSSESQKSEADLPRQHSVLEALGDNSFPCSLGLLAEFSTCDCRPDVSVFLLAVNSFWLLEADTLVYVFLSPNPRPVMVG